MGWRMVDTAHLGVIAANITGHSVSELTPSDDSTSRRRHEHTRSPLMFGPVSAFSPTGPAHGSRAMSRFPGPSRTERGSAAWNTSTTTPDVSYTFLLVFSKDELPAADYPNIYFPANLVAVNRDGSFGRHDTAVVLGKFFPIESTTCSVPLLRVIRGLVREEPAEVHDRGVVLLAEGDVAVDAAAVRREEDVREVRWTAACRGPSGRAGTACTGFTSRASWCSCSGR